MANVSEFILDCQARESGKNTTHFASTHFDDSECQVAYRWRLFERTQQLGNHIVTNWNASDIDSNQSLKSNKTETHIC